MRTVFTSEYLSDLYHVSRYPSFYAIDKLGNVRTWVEGYDKKSFRQLDRLIGALLKENSPK
jgi:hypothetical protein